MPEPNHTDLVRRMDNLIRLGIIAEVDCPNARVRVQSGDILTDWLPWLTLRAGTTAIWSPPSVGEQCLILAVSGELTTAIVLVGIYTQNAPSQSADEFVQQFPDGAKICYNHATSALTATGIATATINASQSITCDTPSLTCTGDVVIKGALSVKGAISTDSSVKAKGEVSGNGISLSSHKHSGVESGNKTTGAPQK